MTNVKTVILVWTTKVCNLNSNNMHNFWGLGDIIRGTIQMYQLSKILNFQLIVDIQLHQLSQFLKKREHLFSNLIYENKDNILFISNVKNKILEHKDDILYCFTNDIFYEPITDDCKEFIKDILTPNDIFQQYIFEKNILQNKSYNIFHFRLGDNELVRNNINNNFEKYTLYLDKEINNNELQQNNILLSDSYMFKQYIKQNFNYSNLFMFDTNIGHLGYHTDENKLKDTLFEFFILTKANKINTYSVHSWTSGFVTICNNIYDIPLSIIVL